MDFIRKKVVGTVRMCVYSGGHAKIMERFINLCRNNKICIWSLSDSEKCFYIYTYLNQIDDVENVCKKCGVRSEIINEQGIPAFIRHTLKKQYLLSGVIIGFMITRLCAMFLWNIDISGNYTYSDNELLECLDGWNIHTGTKISKIQCKELEKAIRLEYDDISFVSAQIKGTVLSIIIKEGINYGEESVSLRNCSIVSDEDGIIESIITRNGVAKVKEGDSVKKNDILISGIIENKDDSGNLTKKEACIADGDVYVKCNIIKKFSFPMEFISKEYTKNNKKAVYIRLRQGGAKFFLCKPLKVYDNCDIMVEDFCLKFADTFSTPLQIGKVKYYEVNDNEIEYTKDEAKNYAQQIIKEYVDNLQSDDFQIQNYDISLDFKEGKARAVANMQCIKKMTKIVSVSDDELKLEVEPSGNN